jgi:hypothetical protein
LILGFAGGVALTGAVDEVVVVEDGGKSRAAGAFLVLDSNVTLQHHYNIYTAPLPT